ncbi:arylsulfatase [Tautonia plasticadhaerens]|uniref:Arylsulfatase n=1 Tax=Tautonia plasticadhaerens TaxID=2527974 RepID=A0A518HEQ4_9BACT|nr:arylsulfatase [Tautonia plasticadhaerens]QDV39339.1 Arylsulfatase [Tautonia plasticadhaerens]
MRRRPSAAGSLALSLAIAWGSAAPASQGRPPNVVLIVADDLGYAELGCFGQKLIRTPVLNRLASEGMRLTSFYSGSPVCAPSRCTLMTGKHTGHSYIRNNGNPPGRVRDDERGLFPGQNPIPDDEVTLAELFKRLGYATGAIGKWGLGFEGSTGDPNRQGFDRFFGYLCQAHAHNHYPRYLWRDGRQVPLPGNDRGQTGAIHAQEEFSEEALRFVREHRDGPFFLYLPFTIPHVSIQAPEQWIARYRGTLGDDPGWINENPLGYTSHPTPHAGYAAMVSYLDHEIGRLLGEIDALGLGGDTIVFFSSDNGPTHGRVGGADSRYFDSAGPFRGLKGDVYEGGLRVPTIARWPGRIPGGTASDAVGYFPDVMPTLLDLAGAPDLVPEDIDGLSLAPTLLGRPEEQERHEYLYWEFPGYGGQQAVRLGDWKGVRTDLIRRGDAGTELYNLASDPTELHDVSGEHPEILGRIERIMAEAREPSPLFPIPVLDAPDDRQ